MKTMIKIATLCAAMTLTPAAFANSSSLAPSLLPKTSTNIQHGYSLEYSFPGSSTEQFYTRVGITQLKKGNVEKAERAFLAVLRANPKNAVAKYVITEIELSRAIAAQEKS